MAALPIIQPDNPLLRRQAQRVILARLQDEAEAIAGDVSGAQ